MRILVVVASIVSLIVGFILGVFTDWTKNWSADFFARRNVRNALKAEIAAQVVNLNFFIRTAIESVAEQGTIAKHYFDSTVHLQGFEFYWNDRRENLLRLPEWQRLKGWDENLSAILAPGHPPLFRAIMLLEGLTIAPLSECVDRGSMAVIRNVLAEPNISEYKMRYLLEKSGLRGH